MKTTDTALSAVLTADDGRRGTKVERTLERLGEAYRETFDGACSQDFSNSILAQALSRDAGTEITRDMVRTYRMKKGA